MSFESEIIDNIGEVILLGTGGYGESIIIHRGDNKWVVIDSCINPKNSNCLPIEYLKYRNVNVENDVEFVICTHWHNDHIRGISEVLEKAINANLVFTNATDQKKFIQLVALDCLKLKNRTTNCSTNEFAKCLSILAKRNRIPIYASMDRLISSQITKENIQTKIFALSPSDLTLQNFNLEISQLITEYGKSNRKIPNNGPNAKSIALYIELGFHSVILGADLEVELKSPKEGWLNILDASQVIRGKKASLIKVPHHGSENGFHERIWLELLQKNPVAKTTTYNKKNYLPTIDMIERYSNLTDKFYLTSAHHNPKMKKREKEINSLLGFMKERLSEIKYDFGIIRSRINMNNENDHWTVETFGNGFHIPSKL
jgi:beta-lactamase superfamily II metal-dependent hydrolase